MSDAASTYETPRARAVAGLAVEPLLSRAEELARRWAIALILQRPLRDIGGIPLQELGRDAPSMCGQAIRALQSDAELDRLSEAGAAGARGQSSPVRSLARVAGAPGAGELVQAVEALRGVLWEALLEEIRVTPGGTGSRQLLDAGDRLAYVCARMLVAALGEDDGPTQERGADPTASRHARGGREAASERAGAVVVDERAEHRGAAPRSAAEQEAPAASSAPPGRAALRAQAPGPAVLRDERASPPPLGSSTRPRAEVWVQERAPASRATPEEIAIHDARGDQGPAAWIGSIGRQLDRLREDGLPFAVLLVEPLELERLRATEPATELLRLADEVEDALAVALRLVPRRELGDRPAEAGDAPRSDSLTRERPGRYWLLAPESDRTGAERLAERLSRAVASLVEHRGAPVEVVIGIAVCPRDGTDAPALAAHADVGLYAARSTRSRPRRAAWTEGRS